MIRRWVTSYRQYAVVIGLGLGTQAEIWSQPVLVADRSALAPIALGMTIALFFRLRAPLLPLGVALVAVRLEDAALSIDHNYGPIMTVVLYMAAIYSAAAHTRGRAYLVATLLVAGFQLLVFELDALQTTLTDFVFVGIFAWGPFLAGTAIRIRREREELLAREQDERARQAVADERTRIARELHDVVAHAISVIVL